ncbi:MAG: septal ring lytic transglycosylase RlpA family protein [Spirochaetaceae bacterium]|jgi:rare lipoprotein A|nr:septal ring lytic transglycosylase RlpA family protein [Spirochaetaceae bacterium]
MKKIIPLLLVIFLSPVLLVSGQTLSDSGSGFFRQEGIASWYGAEFAGRPTASGEIFDPALLTAAHPTLPFGTFLKITNTHNNKQVVIRVNDRGPFVSTRILDVSRAAAEQLDMLSTGTAPVVVESLAPVSLPGESSVIPAPETTTQIQSPALPPVTQIQTPAPVIQTPPPAIQTPPVPYPYPPQPPAGVQNPAPPPFPEVPVPGGNPGYGYVPQPPNDQTGFSQPVIPLTARIIPGIPPAGTGKQYRLQVGSYKGARYALEAFDKLKNLGLSPAYERYEEYYRVVLSGINADAIPSLAERLGTAGFPEVLVREER